MAGLPESYQQSANPLSADSWARTLDVGQFKFTNLFTNGLENHLGLRSSWRGGLSGTLLEFAIPTAEHGQKIVEPWKQIVTPFVPSIGAKPQDLVIVFLRLFNQPFNADVPAGPSTP